MSEAPPPKVSVRPARSAARAVVPEPVHPQGPRSTRWRALAENWGLNALSIAKERWIEARRADVYTKLKAGVVGLWLILAVAGIAVACPQGLHRGNSLGAELVLAGDRDRPVYMIRNASSDLWEDVTVVVNHEYRVSVAQVEPGRDITFTTKQLMGSNGTLAPSDLRLVDVELRTDDDEVELMQEGRLP